MTLHTKGTGAVSETIEKKEGGRPHGYFGRRIRVEKGGPRACL